jgi:hypothetical protein
MRLCFAKFHCDVDHDVVMLGEAYKRDSIRRYAQSSIKTGVVIKPLSKVELSLLSLYDAPALDVSCSSKIEPFRCTCDS